jgi:hypothetical protein
LGKPHGSAAALTLRMGINGEYIIWLLEVTLGALKGAGTEYDFASSGY